MPKRIVFLAAVVSLASAPVASAQQFFCAMGYASAASDAGATLVDGGSRADTSGTAVDPFFLLTACSGRSFLSDNPSLLSRRNGAPGTWGGFRASDGLGGNLRGLGNYVGSGDRGVVRPEDDGSGMPMGVAVIRFDDGGDDGGAGLASTDPRSNVPGAICDYFTGANCGNGPGASGGTTGYGGGSGTPGGIISSDPQAFVGVVQGANGGNGNGNGTGTNVGNGNGPSFDDLGVTVVDDLVLPAQSADVAPEPATMLLVASGLMGMSVAGRRRKR